jgi:hypothetical protein
MDSERKVGGNRIGGLKNNAALPGFVPGWVLHNLLFYNYLNSFQPGFCFRMNTLPTLKVVRIMLLNSRIYAYQKHIARSPGPANVG